MSTIGFLHRWALRSSAQESPLNPIGRHIELCGGREQKCLEKDQRDQFEQQQLSDKPSEPVSPVCVSEIVHCASFAAVATTCRAISRNNMKSF